MRFLTENYKHTHGNIVVESRLVPVEEITRASPPRMTPVALDVMQDIAITRFQTICPSALRYFFVAGCNYITRAS